MCVLSILVVFVQFKYHFAGFGVSQQGASVWLPRVSQSQSHKFLSAPPPPQCVTTSPVTHGLQDPPPGCVKSRSTPIKCSHKILNDDDALELFKKTLPAPALIQLAESGHAVKSRALAVIENSKGDFRLNLIALALKGKKVSFDKVLSVVNYGRLD